MRAMMRVAAVGVLFVVAGVGNAQLVGEEAPDLPIPRERGGETDS